MAEGPGQGGMMPAFALMLPLLMIAATALWPHQGPRPQDFSVMDAGSRQEVVTPHGEEAAVSHLLIVFAPMDLEPRARAIADARRLIQALIGRSDVEIELVDGPRVVQAVTRDMAAAERALDRNMAPLRTLVLTMR